MILRPRKKRIRDTSDADAVITGVRSTRSKRKRIVREHDSVTEQILRHHVGENSTQQKVDKVMKDEDLRIKSEKCENILVKPQKEEVTETRQCSSLTQDIPLTNDATRVGINGTCDDSIIDVFTVTSDGTTLKQFLNEKSIGTFPQLSPTPDKPSSTQDISQIPGDNAVTYIPNVPPGDSISYFLHVKPEGTTLEFSFSNETDTKIDTEQLNQTQDGSCSPQNIAVTVAENPEQLVLPPPEESTLQDLIIKDDQYQEGVGSVVGDLNKRKVLTEPENLNGQEDVYKQGDLKGQEDLNKLENPNGQGDGNSQDNLKRQLAILLSPSSWSSQLQPIIVAPDGSNTKDILMADEGFSIAKRLSNTDILPTFDIIREYQLLLDYQSRPIRTCDSTNVPFTDLHGASYCVPPSKRFHLLVSRFMAILGKLNSHGFHLIKMAYNDWADEIENACISELRMLEKKVGKRRLFAVFMIQSIT